MEMKKLGELAQFINGDRGKNYPSQADIMKMGDKFFVNAGHLNDNIIDFNDMNYISNEKYEKLNSGKFQQNDILYCLRGSLGKKAIIRDDIEGAIASSLVIIRPKQDLILSEYLLIALESDGIINQLNKANNGSTQPNLSAASVKDYDIYVPEISQQKSIIKKINTVKNIISKRKQQLKLLDELVKSQFIEMFGDPVLNEREWEIKKIEDICKNIYGGGTPSKEHPEYYADGNIPWVTPKDMKYDIINKSLIHINELGVANSSVKIIPINSILMVIRSGILKHTLPIAINTVPITLNQDMKAFVFNDSINTYFLAMQLKIHAVDILTGVRAVTADNLEFNTIKQRFVIVPSLELQNQFANFVKQTDKSKFAIQKSLDETIILYNSLMQEYFA